MFRVKVTLPIIDGVILSNSMVDSCDFKSVCNFASRSFISWTIAFFVLFLIFLHGWCGLAVSTCLYITRLQGLSITPDGESKSDMEPDRPKESTILPSRTSLIAARKRRCDGETITTHDLVGLNTNERVRRNRNYARKEKKRQRHITIITSNKKPVISFYRTTRWRYPSCVILPNRCKRLPFILAHLFNLFCAMSNTTGVMLGGDPEIGSRSILNNIDTPEQAIKVIFEFLHALITYRLCTWLEWRISSKVCGKHRGCRRSAYVLGLISSEIFSEIRIRCQSC